MSAIAGVCRADGGQADPALVAHMLDRLAHRGPDGEGQRAAGPAALGHRLLPTTPEALAEKQPVTDDTHERWLVWDGRLDNGAELRDALGRGAADGAGTDPELALAAYRRWGPAGFGRLAGDFAAALWDAPAGRLVCARDVFGVKPLYYHWDGRRLLFASEVKALFADPGVPRRPDEATIADLLLGAFRDGGATFFDGVRRVPPAHLLVLDAGGPRLERYWDAEPAREPPRADDGEYLDEFRARFVEAVRCRLRSSTPVGVMLSGGVDSTQVAATATALARASGAPDLHAFTIVTEGFLDEDAAAVERLEAAYGMRAHRITVPADRSWLELTLVTGETPCCEGPVSLPPAPVVARGCRVLLSGLGADELGAAAERGHLEDLLGTRPWRFPAEARRRLAAWGHDDVPWRRELAWRLWAQLPPRLRHGTKRLAGRHVPGWIEPAFARRAGLRRWAAPPSPTRLVTRCAQASYDELTRPAMAFVLDRLDATAAETALEVRHPFLDRRLVEFFLAVPPAVKLRDGYRKRFAQRALAGLVPGPIRTREDPAERVPRLARATSSRLEARALAALRRPDARIFAYVRREAIAGLLDAYLERGEPHGALLWRWLVLETWLQRTFPDAAPRSPRP